MSKACAKQACQKSRNNSSTEITYAEGRNKTVTLPFSGSGYINLKCLQGVDPSLRGRKIESMLAAKIQQPSIRLFLQVLTVVVGSRIVLD